MGTVKVTNLNSSHCNIRYHVWIKNIKMKLELCNFSGYKIYPGHGKRFIRIDGKLFNFLSKKSQRSLTFFTQKVEQFAINSNETFTMTRIDLVTTEITQFKFHFDIFYPHVIPYLSAH